MSSPSPSTATPDYPLPAPTTTRNAESRIDVISRESSRAASRSGGSVNSRSSSRLPLAGPSRYMLEDEPGPPPSMTPDVWGSFSERMEMVEDEQDDGRPLVEFHVPHNPNRRPRRMSELRGNSPTSISDTGAVIDMGERSLTGPPALESSTSISDTGAVINLSERYGRASDTLERGRKRRKVEPHPETVSASNDGPDVEFVYLPGEEPPVPVASSSRTRPRKPTPPPVPSKAEPLSAFNCPICFTPPTRATLLPCGHVCCGECLFTSVKTMQRRNQYAPGAQNINAAR